MQVPTYLTGQDKESTEMFVTQKFLFPALSAQPTVIRGAEYVHVSAAITEATSQQQHIELLHTNICNPSFEILDALQFSKRNAGARVPAPLSKFSHYPK